MTLVFPLCYIAYTPILYSNVYSDGIVISVTVVRFLARGVKPNSDGDL